MRFFENRLLRRIFRSKMDEITGEWRKLPNEERTELCSSPNIFRVIKSRKIRLTGYIARVRRGGVHTAFCWGT